MKRQNPKIRLKANSDRISTLPTSVTDIIVSKLPIEEAARTSILSKTWRFKWISLPILIFNDEAIKSLNKKYRLPLFVDEFVKVVNQTLLQHSGSLRVFTLSIPKIENYVNINHLIRYLSNKDVTEVTLQFWGRNRYKLNFTLFDFQNLVTLKLRLCRIEIPLEFHGLHSLIRLELEEVTFGDGALAILTEKCQLLKYLSFREMYHLLNHLNIMASKLEFFMFDGWFLNPISFKTKSLVHASFNVSKPSESLHVFLMAGWSLKKAWQGFQNNLCILSNIQHLRIDSFKFQDDTFQMVSSMLKLVANSPNLGTLFIEIPASTATTVKESCSAGKLSQEEKRSFSASKLKTVEIEGFSGLSCEMEFVELVLAKSPVLESMVIKAIQSVSLYDSLKLLKDLTRFGRAAPYAQLTFLDPEDK